MTALRVASVALVLFLIAAACATSGEPERTQYELDLSDGEGADEAPGPGDWWGPIQGRADEANEQLSDEIQDCLEQLGGDDQIREIGVEARRDDAGSRYELVGVTAYPADAEDHDCVGRIATEYVEAVGTVVGDDFDAWVATFVERSAASTGSCSDESDGMICAVVDADVADGDSDDGGEIEACQEATTTRVDDLVRDQRNCWSGGRYTDRMHTMEDRPIELRAVIFGDVIIDDGTARLLIGYNRPWVESMVSCVVDGLQKVRVEETLGGDPCRAQLRNRAVTLWFGPSFTYMYGE